jgi:hypothetical protein
MYASGISGASALSSSSTLKTMTGKGWQPICRTMIGRRTIALSSLQFARSGQPQCHHPNDVRHRCAGCYRHHLRDAVQAVVMKARLRVARRYTYTVHLRRDAERTGREVTRRLRADGYEGKDVCARCAADVTVGCQGIVTLPDTAHELDIATKPARIYTYGGDHE